MTQNALEPLAHPLIRANPRVAYRHLADGAGGVLLHLDTAAYHGINEMGALIWGFVNEGIRLDELVGRIELVAQGVDEYVDDVGAGIEADAPDVLHDHRAREGTVRVTEEELE